MALRFLKVVNLFLNYFSLIWCYHSRKQKG